MDWNIILDVFKNYGMAGGSLAVIGVGLVALFKSQWFSNLANKVTDMLLERSMRKKTESVSNQMKLISESDITNHDIFTYIDFWIYSKVPTLQFSTEFRTVVFRKYLTIFLKSHKRILSEFILSKEFESMDDAQIWKALLQLLNKIVFEYETEMNSVSIPRIVIDKMKVKNNDTIVLTIDLIEGICNSQFYDSDKNLLKVYSILNILLSVLENTLSNSEVVCNSINGQLKGQKFEGFTEP
jgi:hypothetical protein